MTAPDFPIARICTAWARGEIQFMRAKRQLRLWSPDDAQIEAWLVSAKQPPAPGYGSWSLRRSDPDAVAAALRPTAHDSALMRRA